MRGAPLCLGDDGRCRHRNPFVLRATAQLLLPPTVALFRLVVHPFSEIHPSYLHRQSALSGASSRHSGGEGLLTVSDSDRGHGSVYRLGDVPSQFFRHPIQTRRDRRVSEVRTAVSTPWSRGRVG